VSAAAPAFPEMDHAIVDVESAPLGTFVSITEPGLAHGRDGNPTPVPARISTEGIPRLLDPAEARELARLLERAATACDAENAALLPPLEEYAERYRERHGEEARR
jgi:hypothetical protein